MVQKCPAVITLKDDKGKIVFEVCQRRSKAIKSFLEKALQEKWVAKDDVFWIVKNTEQSKNIWEYLQLKEKLKKEEENGNETNISKI